jgi:HD-like signal output (HDOD) protein
MIRAVADIARGIKPVPPVPPEVNEYFMLKEYPNMSLEEIRNLSKEDFHIFSTLASTANSVENAVTEQEMRKAQR